MLIIRRWYRQWLGIREELGEQRKGENILAAVKAIWLARIPFSGITVILDDKEQTRPGSKHADNELAIGREFRLVMRIEM